MLKPLRSDPQGRGVRELILALEQAGIRARQAAFNLLALATDQASRMLNRMGGDQAGFPGGYLVLDCPTIRGGGTSTSGAMGQHAVGKGRYAATADSLLLP